MNAIESHHVLVKFGDALPYETRCQALLWFETKLREMSGQRIEVFQSARGDDSKLRALMTPEQRAKL